MKTIQPAPGTIVMGIFGFTGKQEQNSEFFRPKVYNALFQLSKDEKFKHIFRDIYFSLVSAGYYYSKQIEEILFRLGTGNVLVEKSPTHRMLEISSEAKKATREYLTKQYAGEDVKLMETAAKRFMELAR